MTDVNFMLQDILSTLLGFLIFPLILIVPGYVAGWSQNLLSFRARPFHSRLVVALLLSFAVSPILFYLSSSLLSSTASLILLAVLFVTFLCLLYIDKPSLPSFHDRATKWVVAAAVIWTIVGLFSLVDIQFADGLYFSVVGYDHTTRISIVDAMTRTGVPPVNPSYYPGEPVLLTSLYFFWYVLGSLVDTLGGSLVDARGAFFASAIWSGLALMALIAFYLRIRKRNNAGAIWSAALVGIGLLLITGLDFLPATLAMQQIHAVVGDIEHWNEQITAWMGSMLWVPHHLAALIACTTGALLAVDMRGQITKRKFVHMFFAGMAFASGVGLSTWVTLVFVLFWGIWIVVYLIRTKDRALTLPMLFAGVVGLLLALPFLLGVVSGGGEGGAGGAVPIAFEPRSFSILEGLVSSSPQWVRYVFRLLLLPINYFFELGFFMYAGFLWLRWNRRSSAEDPYALMEILLFGTSFFVGTFLRSTIITNNDLGWRSWLPGQFVLLIWGVDILAPWLVSKRAAPRYSPRIKLNLILLLTFGFVSTLMDVFLLRTGYYFYYGSEIGREILSARQVYAVVNSLTPEDAVVQYNPASHVNRPSGLYGNRQSAISDRSAYGVSVEVYTAKVAEVQKIFDLQNISAWQPVDELCDLHHIDVLVLANEDALWPSLADLVNERSPLYQNRYFAAIACGRNAASPSP